MRGAPEAGGAKGRFERTLLAKLYKLRLTMSACENASASRSGDAAPKTFNVKTFNVKLFRGDYSSLEDAVPLSLEDDIRTWKRY